MVQQYTYSRSPDHPYALEMLPLTKEELDNLRMDAKMAYHALFSAVQTAVRFGSNTEVFNVAHRSHNKSLAMWTTSVLFGTLEEVAALYLDQNEQVPIVLDSAQSRLLYELEKPSSDKPLHGAAMRWSLWKPPSKLSDGRDMCYLEYMDSFIDRVTGRRVWARSMRSINHLSCPSSQHPQGPIRTYMRVSGMIFRETDRPNILEHVTFVHVDGKGTPNWVVQQAIAANKKAADNLNQVLKIMRQLKTQQVPGSSTFIRSNLSQSDGSRDCKACAEHISKWTIAKRCRFCYAILCKKCVEICYHRADTSGKNYRLCLTCAVSTDSANRTSSELSYNVPERSHTRPQNAQNAVVIDKRERKQTSLLTNVMQSSVCPGNGHPSISVTSFAGRGSRDPTEQVEHIQIYNPRTYSSSVSSTNSNGAESKQRLHNARGSRALTLDLEPRRPEPIDLSYLSDLVTPRAGATRGVDI
ncbi:unnamed protein product [Peronospora belbahrii]|uniref:FYVE-type domain-containing protein n=1 Tax=Peronospora belbahrii TaxID=622444 RepID=A0AAU9LB93_9STRA|nr:unnamed protein product [Peronospora belbahrii]CAH0521835.1 unnamed protein product [Peronospora belbahrii]